MLFYLAVGLVGVMVVSMLGAGAILILSQWTSWRIECRRCRTWHLPNDYQAHRRTCGKKRLSQEEQGGYAEEDVRG